MVKMADLVGTQYRLSDALPEVSPKEFYDKVKGLKLNDFVVVAPCRIGVIVHAEQLTGFRFKRKAIPHGPQKGMLRLTRVK